MKANLRKRILGFTLLEVMVALAIFATTALALMKIAMNYTQSIEHNQLRTYAHFVAMNTAAKIRIEQKWLTGSATEEVQQQGESWKVIQTSTSTVSPDVQQIDIQVLHVDANNTQQQERGITTLTIFNYRQQDVQRQP